MSPTRVLQQHHPLVALQRQYSRYFRASNLSEKQSDQIRGLHLIMENATITITANGVHHDLGEKKVDFLFDNREFSNA